MKENTENANNGRRKFMVGAGSLAAGLALARFMDMASSAQASETTAKKWPWPYVKLDPATTAELAYKEWYRVFCGAAVINSIFSQLAEKVGEPYKSFPADAFIFLEGGMAGFGTVCGSIAGANVASNLIVGPRIAGTQDGALMGADIFDWYAETAMPVFTPKSPKITTKIVQTTSNSPLCHISVGRWMKAADKPLGSAERKDRCARVAASVAYHLVEKLNLWHEGKFAATGDISCAKEHGITGQRNCTDCHGDNVPTPPRAKK